MGWDSGQIGFGYFYKNGVCASDAFIYLRFGSGWGRIQVFLAPLWVFEKLIFEKYITNGILSIRKTVESCFTSIQ